MRTISWRRKRQPVLTFLPGKSHGQGSLAGYCHKRVSYNLATKHHQALLTWPLVNQGGCGEPNSLPSTNKPRESDEEPGRRKACSEMQLIFCSDSLGLSGLGFLICKMGVGGEGVCTGCSHESLSALTHWRSRGAQELWSCCVPVCVRETLSHIMHGRAQQQKLEPEEPERP